MTVGASALVVDASAGVDHLLRQPTAARLAKEIFADGITLHAPEIIDVETMQVLRRLELAGTLSPWEARQPRVDAGEPPIEPHPLRPYLDRVWSVRHRITGTAPLLTTDRGFARTVATMNSIPVIAVDG